VRASGAGLGAGTGLGEAAGGGLVVTFGLVVPGEGAGALRGLAPLVISGEALLPEGVLPVGPAEVVASGVEDVVWSC